MLNWATVKNEVIALIRYKLEQGFSKWLESYPVKVIQVSIVEDISLMAYLQ